MAAQAYSLALRGQASGAKAPRFNLRRGEFAFKGDYDYLKDKMGLLASFAATLLLLLIASGVVRNSVLARREAQVDKVLCDVTQRILGSCEKNYDIALNRLKGVESPAAALPKLSAVNLLAELTQRVPADVPVTFDRIDIDLERISVRGVTDSSKQIDTIAAALRGHRCFKEVKEGKVEKTREGNKVSFRLDIQVQCAEQLQASEG
jgi:general secretion pathway protein L